MAHRGQAGPNSGQLALDLAFRPAMSREDFLVASSNEEAVRQIDRWPDWSAPTLLIVGPEGSGKSHLAEVVALPHTVSSAVRALQHCVGRICGQSRGPKRFDLSRLPFRR